MEQALLRLEGITVRFRGVLAVDGIDMAFQTGKIYGLIGTNGAGKSTTIKAILGLIRPEGGSVTINGKEALLLTGAEKEKIGVALGGSGFSGYLSIEDVIGILKKMYRSFDEEYFRNNCRYQRLPFDKQIKDKYPQSVEGYDIDKSIAALED